MNVIDVTIVGGPDLAAVVQREPVGGGTLVRVTVANGGPGPARLQEVVVPVECPPMRQVVVHGFDDVDPGGEGPPGAVGALAPGPLVESDQGAIGWVGATRHRGTVTVQRDGWLLTARADLAGIVLGPGEAVPLDALWVGEGLAGYLRAWGGVHGRSRPVAAVTGVVVAPGGTPAALDAAAARLEAGDAGPVALVAGAPDDLDVVAARADRLGVGWGVVLTPFGRPTHPLDLSRPGALAQVRAAGDRLRDQQAPWVVVGGVAAALGATRWGASAATPVTALRAGLAALRDALGPGPVLHVADGPPWSAVGVADVVTTGPPWPHPATVVAAARRSPLQPGLWTAAPGALAYTTPREVLDELAAVTGPRVLWPPAAGPARPGGPGPLPS